MQLFVRQRVQRSISQRQLIASTFCSFPHVIIAAHAAAVAGPALAGQWRALCKWGQMCVGTIVREAFACMLGRKGGRGRARSISLRVSGAIFFFFTKYSPY